MKRGKRWCCHAGKWAHHSKAAFGGDLLRFCWKIADDLQDAHGVKSVRGMLSNRLMILIELRRQNEVVDNGCIRLRRRPVPFCLLFRHGPLQAGTGTSKCGIKKAVPSGPQLVPCSIPFEAAASLNRLLPTVWRQPLAAGYSFNSACTISRCVGSTTGSQVMSVNRLSVLL